MERRAMNSGQAPGPQRRRKQDPSNLMAMLFKNKRWAGCG